MAAITQRLIRLRPVQGHLPNPLRLFSSSSDTGPPSEPKPEPESQSPSHPSFSSYFADVKASLQNEPSPQHRLPTLRRPPSLSNPSPSPPPLTPPPPRVAYLEEIHRNLSEYRSRSAPAPPPPGASSGPSISLQELYNRHTSPNNEDSPSAAGLKPRIAPSLGPIKDSLRHLRFPPSRNQNDSQSKTIDPVSLARFKESMKLKPGKNADHGSSTIGGGDGLPSIFHKEMNQSGDDNLDSTPSMRTQFVRMYTYSELGEKLQKLRPEKKKGNWFSLHELNQRLANLRLIEENKSKEEMGGGPFWELRQTIAKMTNDEQNQKRRTTQKVNILSQIGGTPSFMLSPPKDDLVEKYFHPDNMSSAEKLKLELKKVRDEFKMTESDCGSARVQVAQLSTKIKHLSTVLKKKDKHSRRGLEAMLDRRRKLLKYLRRTDWDSYCLVLSKFSIRDNNPDIKPTHKNKA